MSHTSFHVVGTLSFKAGGGGDNFSTLHLKDQLKPELLLDKKQEIFLCGVYFDITGDEA
jgi:hypothetical protein